VPISRLYKVEQQTEPGTYDALKRRIHNTYNFDNPYEKQKLINNEPTQLEMTPIDDDDMPF